MRVVLYCLPALLAPVAYYLTIPLGDLLNYSLDDYYRIPKVIICLDDDFTKMTIIGLFTAV